MYSFFGELVEKDRDISELFKSKVHFVDAGLATLYGVVPPGGTGRVEIAGVDRQGVLGLAGVLAAMPGTVEIFLLWSWLLRPIPLSAVPVIFLQTSFLTVVIERVPRRESIVAPRSRCPRCGTEIRTRDNVPLFSYLALRGRCRSCGARISPLYPLVELATAGLFAGVGAAFPRLVPAAMVAAFVGLLVAVAVIDVRHRIIPNRIVYPSFVAFAVLVVVGAVAGQGLDAGRAGIGLAAFATRSISDR